MARHKKLDGVGRQLAKAVQDFRNLPELKRSKIRNTNEYQTLCSAWKKFELWDEQLRGKTNE